MTQLKEGDLAPSIDGVDQHGEPISWDTFRGKKLILYFYPKDNTPTCTEEACNLRDNYGALLDKGFAILGVSADSQRKHQNFINKFDLPFPLLSDTERTVIEAYGLWVKKKMYGKEYFGIARVTFVVDENGKILKVIDKVDARNHSAQILEALNMN